MRPSTTNLACRAVVLLAAAAVPGQAGEVELTNGVVIEGTPVPIQGLTTSATRSTRTPTKVYPMLMVDAGFKRYFVNASRRRVARVDQAADLASRVTFDLKHRRMVRNFAVTVLGPIVDRQTFDAFGRRTVVIETSKGREPVIQGIKRISPHEITVEGLNVVWEHGLATSSVDPIVLDPILRGLVDQDDPKGRMSIALFYLQADRFAECDRELAAIRTRFPELEGRVEEIELQLRQLWARELTAEIRRRQRAGQHDLAWRSAKQFPTRNMSAAVLREADEILSDYDEATVKAHRTVDLLGSLQSELDGDERVAKLAPMRTVVKQGLDVESLPRLEPFLNLAEDDTLQPTEKLALAYSGWVLGAENAVTDLDATLRVWDARFLLREYLRSDDPRLRAEYLKSLLGTEGVDVRRLQQMITWLPPVLDSSTVTPGEPSRVEVAPSTTDSPGLAYQVLLPQEYRPSHRYPLIVALHPSELNATAELEWWGVVRKFEGAPARPGQSQRRGYVVIAPEYLDAGEAYDYGAATHRIVTKSIRDARKRFSIDSDRVFLSGHGSGGDAAFDIGMSRPDLFAGVIPITGVSRKYCQWYWPNSEHVPFYVVSGELDRDTASANARDLTRMIKNYHDIVFCEYVGRGYESYFEEIHQLFDWMDRHRRVKHPREIEMKILRPTDNRFYWIESYGLPPKVAQSNAQLLASTVGRGGVVPSALEARFSEANGLDIRRSGGESHVVWLNEELVDFEKRFTIHEKGRQKFNAFLEPSARVMLDDLRVRGDREKLFTVRIAIN